MASPLDSIPIHILASPSREAGTAARHLGFSAVTDRTEIAATAKPGRHVIGWKLAKPDRAALLERFAPRYQHVVADHVTLVANVSAKTPLPGSAPASVVGYASDHAGVEALIVAIGGSTDRPDGSTYHMTWSLGPGRRAQESNDVIARFGWTAVDKLPVTLIPALLT